MVFADATCLPADYCPPNNVAVLGRGKRYINHPGNLRLKEMVLKELPAYNASTTSRKAKSATILRVIDQMREGTEGGIGFVRFDTLTGNLYMVDDGTARVCVAQTFRDCLSKNYRSSKQFKRKKRQEIKDKSPEPGFIPQVQQSDSQVASPPTAFEEQVQEMPALSWSASNTMNEDQFLSCLLQQQGCRATTTQNQPKSHGQTWLETAAQSNACVFPTPTMSQEVSQDALFQSLFKVFSTNTAPVQDSTNPFEPRPIASSTRLSQLFESDLDLFA